jgi:hypothetical protein
MRRAHRRSRKMWLGICESVLSLVLSLVPTLVLSLALTLVYCILGSVWWHPLGKFPPGVFVRKVEGERLMSHQQEPQTSPRRDWFSLFLAKT